jgi:hypothetical protein
MELDDFKKAYQIEAQAQLSKVSPLKSLQLQESKSPIEKMLRNMRLEIVAGFVLTGIIAIWALFFSYELYAKIAALACLMIMTVQALLYRPVIEKTKSGILNSSENTLSWLESTTELLDKFVRFYKRAMWISIPVGFFIGGIIGFYNGYNDPAPADESLSLTITDLLVLACVCLVTSFLFVHFFTKYYYQIHVDRLKKLLDELRSEA